MLKTDAYHKLKTGLYKLKTLYKNMVYCMYGNDQSELKFLKLKELLITFYKNGSQTVYRRTVSLNLNSKNIWKYLDKKYRTALSIFRISSHNLHIEYGRYNNTPRNQRLLQFKRLSLDKMLNKDLYLYYFIRWNRTMVTLLTLRWNKILQFVDSRKLNEFIYHEEDLSQRGNGSPNVIFN